MTTKVKDQIAEQLNAMKNGKLLPADRKSNVGKFLADIYFWQESNRTSTEKLKEAWAAAQKEGGPVPSDDELRTYGKGEHIVVESNSLTCMAKLTAPVKRFDQEKFIDAVSKKYKIKRDVLEALAEVCKTEGKPALSKVIVEV